MHVRLRLLKSWVDAAIVMGRHGGECAFIHFPSPEEFCLEVNFKKSVLLKINVITQIHVKVEVMSANDQDPLISELAYMVSKLHRDMYSSVQTGEIALQHFVVIPNTLQVLLYSSLPLVENVFTIFRRYLLM